jgi:hypothetical protein
MVVKETEICVSHRDLNDKMGARNFAWADFGFENCGTVYL